MLCYIIVLLLKVMLVNLEPTADLIKSLNYPWEEHYVTTNDGYILTIHRIPQKNQQKPAAEPILLLHGLLESSSDFIIGGGNFSLASILYANGYDVWLPNFRGNYFSRKHKNLNPKDSKFWDFSWHEIGVFDITASIDYILNYTKMPKVHFIGYSQGGTVFFVLLSIQPKYQQFLASVNLLAPIVFAKHNTNKGFPIIQPLIDKKTKSLQEDGLWELLPRGDFTEIFGKTTCAFDSPSQIYCSMITTLLFGISKQKTDKILLSKLFQVFPSGASFKQLLHFAQLGNSGEFQQFDYGNPKDNLKVYGQTTPPKYNLSNITIPLRIFRGTADAFVSKHDFTLLKSALKYTTTEYIEVEGFNHIDVIYGRQAKKLVFNNILAFLKNYKYKK